jgi:hypothetical protein
MQFLETSTDFPAVGQTEQYRQSQCAASQRLGILDAACTEKIISNSYAGEEIAHPIEKQPSFAIDSSLNRATAWHSAARLASRCIERPEERTKHAHDGHILQPEPADENIISVARAVRHSGYSEQYLRRPAERQTSLVPKP